VAGAGRTTGDAVGRTSEANVLAGSGRADEAAPCPRRTVDQSEEAGRSIGLFVGNHQQGDREDPRATELGEAPNRGPSQGTEPQRRGNGSYGTGSRTGPRGRGCHSGVFGARRPNARQTSILQRLVTRRPTRFPRRSRQTSTD